MRSFWLAGLLLALTGCVAPQQSPQPVQSNQCIGAMTAEDAYGHLDPNHYTIQVLALSEERDVKSYIRQIQDQQPIWVHWKKSRGTRWYAVIYGDFKTKLEAKQRIASFPPAIRQQGPFVVSFADVQQDKQSDVFRLR